MALKHLIESLQCSEVRYVSPMLGLETDWFNIPLINYMTLVSYLTTRASVSLFIKCDWERWSMDDKLLCRFFFFSVSVYKVVQISWWAIYAFVKWNKTLILRHIFFPLHQPKLHISLLTLLLEVIMYFPRAK